MRYIEDILTSIGRNFRNLPEIPDRDSLVLESFYEIHQRGEFLTKNQGSYLLKLLNRYQIVFKKAGLDYIDDIEEPHWKLNFRSLDLSKKLYVVNNETLSICMKFPYSLKEKFEKEFDVGSKDVGVWDNDEKVRKFDLYECNLIHLNNFAVDNNFEISESFIELLANFEEILLQQDRILLVSKIVNNQVTLINASDETLLWWQNHKTGNLHDDLILAKSMGFFLINSPSTIIEKIAASPNTNFWMRSEIEFLKIAKLLSGKFVLILDRVYNNFNWLEKFTEFAEKIGFTAEEIKICFRADREENPFFNEWVRKKGYGGRVDTGRLLVFNHKPAKWIFKNPEEIKIIVTNNIYPPTDNSTRDWMSSHPFVVYLGDIKPSKIKDQQIVEL